MLWRHSFEGTHLCYQPSGGCLTAMSVLTKNRVLRGTYLVFGPTYAKSFINLPLDEADKVWFTNFTKSFTNDQLMETSIGQCIISLCSTTLSFATHVIWERNWNSWLKRCNEWAIYLVQSGFWHIWITRVIVHAIRTYSAASNVL